MSFFYCMTIRCISGRVLVKMSLEVHGNGKSRDRADGRLKTRHRVSHVLNGCKQQLRSVVLLRLNGHTTHAVAVRCVACQRLQMLHPGFRVAAGRGRDVGECGEQGGLALLQLSDAALYRIALPTQVLSMLHVGLIHAQLRLQVALLKRAMEIDETFVQKQSRKQCKGVLGCRKSGAQPLAFCM